MSRTTRVAAAVSAGAVAAALALPGLAVAGTPEREAARASAATSRAQIDNPVFAGYVSPLTKKKTVVGTYTVPTLDCGTTDEGIDTFVELAADGGAQYIDGSVYSSCVDGVGQHYAAFDTSTEGQIAIEEVVEDGDKITVTSSFKKGKTKVTIESSQGWTAKDSFSGFEPTEAAVLQYSILVGTQPVAPLSENTSAKGVQVGGKDLKKSNPTSYTLVDDSGDTLIKPGKIKKGTDFKWTYVG